MTMIVADIEKQLKEWLSVFINALNIKQFGNFKLSLNIQIADGMSHYYLFLVELYTYCAESTYHDSQIYIQ